MKKKYQLHNNFKMVKGLSSPTKNATAEEEIHKIPKIGIIFQRLFSSKNW